MAQTASVAGTPNLANEGRLRSMVDCHMDSVWRAVRRLGVPEAGADDAAQQVFIVAARRLPDIEPGRERPYLLGIALRVASDARRAAQRRREIPMNLRTDFEAEARRSPDHLLDEKRGARGPDDHPEGLSAELREAFVLFELEELSAGEVAELVGVPVGTVASRVRRAREAIHRAVARRSREP